MDKAVNRSIFRLMGWQETARKNVGRARYAAAQALRSGWYSAQLARARAGAAPLRAEGEPVFKSAHGPPDRAALMRAYFDLFAADRRNIEDGLYQAPDDLRLENLPSTLRAARAFREDAEAVDARRVAQRGDEIKMSVPDGQNRYPDYFLQNFHFQSGGWFTEDSAALYDTQVEALFSGTADAMRRAALADIARELRGRDQRRVSLLDLACGNGRFLESVMTNFPRLQAAGLDLSPSYTEAARARLAPWRQVDILHDAAESMPIENDSLDLVVSIFLFHELPPRVRADVLRDVARVLKPGGAFILADSLQFRDTPGLDAYLEFFPEAFHEPYFKSYLNWDLAEAMAPCGFSLERTTHAFLTKVTVWRKT